MKTALQQLIDHLDPIHSGIKQKAIELLEVEAEQLIEFFEKGYDSGYDNNGVSGYQHYHETYTK
jgi:hypothetical protein